MSLPQHIIDHAMKIGAKFLSWSRETGPCPISVVDTTSVWGKRLCGLFETQAILEAELTTLRAQLAMKDDALSSYAEFYDKAANIAGLPEGALPSEETDEIILHKLAEHDEIEALKGGAE